MILWLSEDNGSLDTQVTDMLRYQYVRKTVYHYLRADVVVDVVNVQRQRLDDRLDCRFVDRQLTGLLNWNLLGSKLNRSCEPLVATLEEVNEE